MRKKRKSRAQNSASSARGRPFEKGNPHAFKPGQSGNPGGRPKTCDLIEAYREQLAKVIANDPEGRTFAEVIAETMIYAAARGNRGAAREIADRVYGKPRQQVDVDLEITDWRELAQAHGISESEIIEQ